MPMCSKLDLEFIREEIITEPSQDETNEDYLKVYIKERCGTCLNMQLFVHAETGAASIHTILIKSALNYQLIESASTPYSAKPFLYRPFTNSFA